jgi:SAM-dependent methyltransferase
MDQRAIALQEEYRQRFERQEQYRDKVWRILCHQYFSKWISPEAKILDLGAGWGEFSRNIPAGKKFAMDLNPDCGERVEGFATFLNQDCAEKWPLSDNELDVVFTSNFLEHLEAKSLVDRTLREAYRCTKPGGRIVCLGPNIRFAFNTYWDFWDHHLPISDESMAEALSLAGFVIESKIPRFLPYSMSGRRNAPTAFLRIYLKFRPVWSIFGRQFLVVATKPEQRPSSE